MFIDAETARWLGRYFLMLLPWGLLAGLFSGLWSACTTEAWRQVLLWTMAMLAGPAAALTRPP
jgi:hypothetical protein